MPGWNRSWLTHNLDFLPWSQTCFIALNLSGNMGYWLNLATIMVPALPFLLRYYGTSQCGLCLPSCHHQLPIGYHWGLTCPCCSTSQSCWKVNFCNMTRLKILPTLTVSPYARKKICLINKHLILCYTGKGFYKPVAKNSKGLNLVSQEACVFYHPWK